METEATIMEYMQDTFQYRKSQIDRELVNATMILDKYPRFIDFDNGRLVKKLVFFLNFQSSRSNFLIFFISFRFMLIFFIDTPRQVTLEKISHRNMHERFSDSPLFTGCRSKIVEIVIHTANWVPCVFIQLTFFVCCYSRLFTSFNALPETLPFSAKDQENSTRIDRGAFHRFPTGINPRRFFFFWF